MSEINGLPALGRHSFLRFLGFIDAAHLASRVDRVVQGAILGRTQRLRPD